MVLANQEFRTSRIELVAVERPTTARSVGLLAAAALIAFIALLAFAPRDARAAGPYDCSDPYYYSSGCPVDGAGAPSASAVSFRLTNRCRARNFVLRPNYSGAAVLSSKLYLNNRKYIFRTAAPFTFRVNVKRMIKGKTYKMRLATVFTSGEAVSLKFNVKRCGKPFKRKKNS